MIGSVEPDLIEKFAGLGIPNGHGLLQRSEQSGWMLNGDIDASLALLAHHLHEAGFADAWRNELLAVRNPQGGVIGRVERAVVRPLGIATQAVHLVGTTPSGHIWLQQRALNKANDPGLWDTLMGGMVSASDTLSQALARETWEEAGLRLHQVQALQHGGHIDFASPATHDGRGTGYLAERIDWFTALVPDGVVPQNQDGEVAQFVCASVEEVLDTMGRGQFTLEAGLILAAAMGLQSG
jgi:8-oxo-dGTP pyrophosphatase MutT (NUDIX family)